MSWKFYRKFLLFIFVILFGMSCETLQSKNPLQSGDDGLDLRSRVHKVVLDNGLTVLMLKREGAPVFSVQTKVRVGSIEEEQGSSGLAHFFEHMAFKGTDKIGTPNYAEEKKILDQIFVIGTQIAQMKKEGKPASAWADLLKQRQALEAEEKKYITKNEFTQIFQVNGGSNLNATTSNDFTTYYVSLPSNKLELWAYLESERFLHSVLREFFTEVDVVAEERRMRFDNTPDGRLYEAYQNLAFDKSPYKVPVIGYPDHIQTYTPALAKAFYEKYYVPSRMVIALVGNFEIKETEAIVRKYFSRLPKKPDPKDDFAKEKLDDSYPRETTVKGKEKPRFYVGYHRPAHPDSADIVFDVIQNVLCEGRTSRLFKKLVLEEKKVAEISCYSSIPGARLDSLFTFYSMPLEGHSNSEIRDDIKNEIQKLQKTGPTEQELQIVKNNIDAELIYSLESNSGLASQLAFYESLTGNWEYIYELQDRIHKMTTTEVQQIVQKYLVPAREVTAYFETEKL